MHLSILLGLRFRVGTDEQHPGASEDPAFKYI